MQHAEALQLCAEEGIRFDAVIPIALSLSCCWTDDALPDVFSCEFFEDWLADTGTDDASVRPLVKGLPSFADLLKDKDFAEFNAVDVADWLIERGHIGILAKVSTPVRRYSVDGRSWKDSWGHTTHTWLYGETLEDLFVAAGDWVDGMVAAWVTKAQEGGAS